VDSPPIQPDRVDRSPRLDQQVDRLADLVLAPIGGLDELAGVEDRRRKGVKAGHHEIARRVVGLFDDVSDLAVVVRVTDAVAGCLIPRHFLDEEGGIRAGFSLAMHDVVEIRLEDVVAQDEHEVVVDIGNGAGGVTPGALRELGCSVETLNAEPDGHFPSRPSEPTEEACESLQAHVAATNADLGIAHDGDADRMMAVDETGSFIGGDALLALFGRRAAGEGDVVAAPLNTSLAVDDTLAEVGATLSRTRVGDVFVAERARETDVVFGGEPSGAWIWPDATLAPDGPLAAARLAALVDREGPLSALVAELPSYPLRRESIEVEGKRELMETVATRAYEAYDVVESLDGVRVEREDGWFLVRASGTQPLVRVTAEGRTEAATAELYDEARALVDEAIGA